MLQRQNIKGREFDPNNSLFSQIFDLISSIISNTIAKWSKIQGYQTIMSIQLTQCFISIVKVHPCQRNKSATRM